MNIELKDQMYLRFEEDWGKPSLQFSVCMKIFDYLLSRPFNQLKHLTYGSLKVAIKENLSDVDLLKAIQYLSGGRVPILSPHFEFIDEDDEPFDLDNKDIRDAQEKGKLVHPGTGEYIENFEDKVVIYFTPSLFIQEIQK